ncbi:MAG: transposase, partial [Methanosarcinaceae archaeon]|nr:transposase [Methanosarcinaceae archaeon]
VCQFSDVFNAITFKEFIEEVILYRQDGKVLLLVLDNSRYHHAKLLNPWLEEHKNEIQLLFYRRIVRI